MVEEASSLVEDPLGVVLPWVEAYLEELGASLEEEAKRILEGDPSVAESFQPLCLDLQVREEDP